jgi:hypothetical protein
MAHIKEHARIREAYLAMAKTARFRPAAPMGGTTSSEEELADQLEEEATAYATKFIEEEDGLKFSIGISNSQTTRALVYAIEAARRLCCVNNDVAAKLLDMAVAELARTNASRAA